MRLGFLRTRWTISRDSTVYLGLFDSEAVVLSSGDFNLTHIFHVCNHDGGDVMEFLL
jgi:hypothetical protein